MTTDKYYARAILNRKPDMTNAQVRFAVLSKTGDMMTEDAIDKIRVIVDRTLKLASRTSEAILKSEGWTAYEAKEILGGLHISIDSPWILAARKKRVDEIIYAETHGSSRNKFLEQILAWYEHDHDRSPFDFLRAEYRPPRKVTGSQYKAAVQRRKVAMQATKGAYIGKYGIDKRKSHHKKGKY